MRTSRILALHLHLLLAAPSCALSILRQWSIHDPAGHICTANAAAPLPQVAAACARLRMQSEDDNLDDAVASKGSASTQLRDTDDNGPGVERSPFLEKLEAMEGIWYSDDFYGTDVAAPTLCPGYLSSL